MAHDVFISHSAKDKVVADAVCSILESKKVRCWMAPRDVLPGMKWGEAIVEAISDSRVMIIIFSSHSNNSQQVIREVEQAVKRGVTILPLRIEDVPLSKDMDYFLSTTHWLDALTPPLEKHLQQLAETVKLLVGRAPPKEASPSDATAGPGAGSGAAFLQVERPESASQGSQTIGRRPRRFSPVSLVLVTLLIGLVCVYLVYTRRISQQTTATPSVRTEPRYSEARKPSVAPTQSPTSSPLISASSSPPQQSVAVKSTLPVEEVKAKELASSLTFAGHRRASMCLVFSPDGKMLVSGGDDLVTDNLVSGENYALSAISTGTKNQGAVRLWDAATGEEKWTLWGSYHPVNSVAISPDGKTIASVSGDENVRITSIEMGTVLRTLTAPQDSVVNVVCFSPDGRWLAGALADKRAVIWNVNTGELKRTFSKHTGEITAVAFSHNGDTLGTASDDRTVALWDPQTGELRGRLSGCRAGVTCVAFSPDDTLLATGSRDGAVVIWEVHSGQPKDLLNAHGDEVNAVAFSRDGKLLASAGDDGQILVWDASSAKLKWRLMEHANKVASIAFSPVDNTLASASWDRKIKLWHVE